METIANAGRNHSRNGAITARYGKWTAQTRRPRGRKITNGLRGSTGLLMIFSTRMSVCIADLYFDEATPPTLELEVDIIRYNQWLTPVAGATCTPVSTIAVNLWRSTDELLSKMKDGARYKIRRAGAKDELSYEFWNDGNSEAIMRFADHFDRCAALKHIPGASLKRLWILARNGALDVSFVRDKFGELLAANSYIVTPSRVRILHTGASFRATTDQIRRALIGRANRYLYWRDMLRFREAGVRIFDFGGYYTGSQDEEKLRVNDFKAQFAGDILHEFNCERAVTLKGEVAIWAIKQRGAWLAQRRSRALQSQREREERHESSLPVSV